MSWFNSLLSGVGNTFLARGRHVQIQKQFYESVVALVRQNPVPAVRCIVVYGIARAVHVDDDLDGLLFEGGVGFVRACC
jgi:hypothetical protein